MRGEGAKGVKWRRNKGPISFRNPILLLRRLRSTQVLYNIGVEYGLQLFAHIGFVNKRTDKRTKVGRCVFFKVMRNKKDITLQPVTLNNERRPGKSQNTTDKGSELNSFSETPKNYSSTILLIQNTQINFPMSIH